MAASKEEGKVQSFNNRLKATLGLLRSMAGLKPVATRLTSNLERELTKRRLTSNEPD